VEDGGDYSGDSDDIKNNEKNITEIKFVVLMITTI
jgi:hypothetical protein